MGITSLELKEVEKCNCFLYKSFLRPIMIGEAALITEKGPINTILKAYGVWKSGVSAYHVREVLSTHPVKFRLEHPLFLVSVAHVVVKKGASRSSQPKTCKSKFHVQELEIEVPDESGHKADFRLVPKGWPRLCQESARGRDLWAPWLSLTEGCNVTHGFHVPLFGAKPSFQGASNYN